MSIKDSPIKELSIAQLIERLEGGWQSVSSGLIQGLVQRWEARLNTKVEIVEIKEDTENILYFKADLSNICLRGMGKVPCIVLGGVADLSNRVRDLYRKIASPHHLPFVLTLTDAVYNQAINVFPRDRSLILSPDQVKGLLDHEEPYEHLKQLLWQQIPKRQLSAYNLLLPAEKSIFFGRHNELDRLREAEEVSFAIAGPGRMGKTSLVKRYREEMISRHDPRSSCRFYINFYDCEDTTPNGVARFFAMAISPSNLSARMTADKLVNFLRHQSSSFGYPIDLLLDEVDLICQGNAFKSLAHAARLGLCRLVLCGRGVLLKTLLGSGSPIDCRLDLIKLEPLDEKSARTLILRPLADLGFKLADPAPLIDKVLRFTGRLPHLIQFSGQKLIEIALNEETDTISLSHIDKLMADFLTAQYFTKPLGEIMDTETQLAALLLLKEGVKEFTVQAAQEVLRRAGLDISHHRMLEICNDLVINNVLAWSNTSFRTVNEGLYYYAREMGYFNGALEEAMALATEFHGGAYETIPKLR